MNFSQRWELPGEVHKGVQGQAAGHLADVDYKQRGHLIPSSVWYRPRVEIILFNTVKNEKSLFSQHSQKGILNLIGT